MPKTPNFTIRVPPEVLSDCREAASLWGKNLPSHFRSSSGKDLNRWIVAVLSQAARIQRNGGDPTGESYEIPSSL